jgi:hypothetical protein
VNASVGTHKEQAWGSLPARTHRLKGVPHATAPFGPNRFIAASSGISAGRRRGPRVGWLGHERR